MNLKLEVELELFENVDIRWYEVVEAAVDNYLTQRLDRTVILDKKSKNSKDRQTDSNFPGFIRNYSLNWTKLDNSESESSNSSQLVSATYECYFPYEPFIDKKNQIESSGEVNWSRVSFDLTCPACDQTDKYSTQNNLTPPRVIKCSCGNNLAEEKKSQPLISTTETVN